MTGCLGQCKAPGKLETSHRLYLVLFLATVEMNALNAFATAYALTPRTARDWPPRKSIFNKG
jgi:hypothetical protein